MNLHHREQDLGLSGLRMAKSPYQPHHLVKKYVDSPKLPVALPPRTSCAWGFALAC